MNIIADELRLKEDQVAQLLIDSIKNFKIDEINLYYNFPFYRGESKNDLVQAHVLLVSPIYGVIFFRCLSNINEYNDEERRRLDDLDGHIFSKINKYEEFRRKRRELKINVTPFIFINSANAHPDSEIVTLINLKDAIESNQKDTLNYEEFELLTSVIEGTVQLRIKKDMIL